MGEQKQEWAWRDLFRSIGLMFSFSRLMIGLCGLIVLAGADGLLNWAVQSVSADWAVELLGYVRLAVAIYIFLYTATAVAYSAKGELLDGEGAGVFESIGFVFRRFGAIFFSPVLFWVYIVLMAGFAFVCFLLPAKIAMWAGWVPYVSLIWYALCYFFWCLFSVLAGMGVLAFGFSLFLSPAIIAVRQEGALDAVLDTIDLMRGKGAFWVSLLALLVSLLVGGAFLGKTFDVGFRIAHRTMGDDFAKIVAAMPEELQPRPGMYLHPAKAYWPGQFAKAWPGFLTCMGVTAETAKPAIGPPAFQGKVEMQHKIAGWTLAIWMLVVAGLAISFTAGAFVMAGTLTYLIVREEEEFLEPVAVDTTTSAPPAQPKASAQVEESEEEEEEEGEEEASGDKDAGQKKSKRKKKSKRS